ncbi:PAS domain S-box protein [uncultured Methanoregula sp.]|uniref:PAS domain S-box protein n=1 Tax=uncultured Methanoregula sp. TaxID=1005933 RepID=UPI002AAACAEA|nr:PAS domain S-box protein [uncultured Methanoregula sp.]
MISILYVDDEPILLEVGKTFLERSGQFSVDTVTSARSALILLDSKNYDAIISDYQMPEMDGIEFLKSLRKENNGIPFILFTGRGREEVVIEAVNNGVDYYLQKGGDSKSQFVELEHKIKLAVERCRTEKALIESEERYRAVVEDQTELISRFLPDGSHIFVNDAYCRYFSKKPDEIIGTRFCPDIPKEDQKRIRDHLKNLTQDNPFATIEQRIIMPDKMIRWQQWSDRAIFDKDGHIREYQSVGRDITDKKHAEDELRAAYEQISATEEELRSQYNELKDGEQAIRESEGKLQGIVQGSPIPQFVIDKNHRVISWNRALEEHSGVRAEEVLGTTHAWKAFYDKERPVLSNLLVENHPEKIQELYAGKFCRSKYVPDAYEAIDFFPRMGEHGTWLYFTAAVLRNSDGNIVGAVETLEDITDRKKAEEELQASNEQITASEEELRHQFDELKKSEDALRISEEKYRSILESIQDVYYRSDTAGNLILISPSVTQILGYNRVSELIGRDIAQTLYYNPEERSKFLAELTTKGVVTDFEVILKKRDGTPVPVATSSHKYFDPSGNFLGVEGIFRDITERKNAEKEIQKKHEEINLAYEQLRSNEKELRKNYVDLSRKDQNLVESERKFRAIFNQTFQFIGLMTPDGILVEANRSALKLSEIEETDVIGKPFWDTPWWIHSKEMQEKLRAAVQDAAKGEFVRFEATHRASDGSLHYIDFSLKPVADDAGCVVLLIPEGRDITKRKEAEKELRESQKMLEEIVQGSPIPQFVIDKNHRIVSWNRALEEHSGVKATEVLGTTHAWKAFYDKERPVLSNLLVENNPEKIHTLYTGKYRKSKYIDGAYEVTDFFPRMGEHGTWLHFTSAPLRDYEGNIVGAVETLQDVTDRKRAEERLFEVNSAFLAFTPDPLRNINILTGLAGKMLQGSCALYNRLEGGMLCSLGMWNTPPDFASYDKPQGHICNDVILKGDRSPAIITDLLKSPYADTDPNVKRYQLQTYIGIPVKIGEKFLGSLCVVYQNRYSPLPQDLEILSFLAKAVSIEDERRSVEMELQIANKKITMLYSITRHDILNQLTGLRSYLELSKVNEKDPKLAEFISREEAAAETIGRQIEFTRYYENIGVNAPRWQDVALLIRSCSSQIPIDTIILTVKLSGMEIYADPLIEKVFYNLIENSIRHGGRVSHIGFTVTETGGDAVLVYEDDGVGITAEDRDRLFAKGFGTHTGLGLFLSREILSITGITITENGKPEQGARFEITVPDGGYRFVGRN